MAIFSPYIQGSVVIQVVLFSRLYDMYEINKSDKGIFTNYVDQILPIFILTLSYRINMPDGISVVVYVFLKNNKRGGSNKHGGKFYGFYHIFQISIF